MIRLPIGNGCALYLTEQEYITLTRRGKQIERARRMRERMMAGRENREQARGYKDRGDISELMELL
ncbi:MAG: hypothetical protein ABSA97_07325 [Verrucomicrobiia bacterium]